MLQELQPDWVQLKKDFDAVPPPRECQPIADEYDGGLGSMIETFASIEKLVGENRGRSSRGLAGRLGYGRRLKKEKKREAAEPKIGFIHDPHP